MDVTRQALVPSTDGVGTPCVFDPELLRTNCTGIEKVGRKFTGIVATGSGALLEAPRRRLLLLRILESNKSFR